MRLSRLSISMGQIIKVDFRAEHKRRAQARRSDRNRDFVFRFFLFVVPAVIILSIGILVAATLMASLWAK